MDDLEGNPEEHDYHEPTRMQVMIMTFHGNATPSPTKRA